MKLPDIAHALDRPLAPDDVRARWREAFAYADRSNAISGLPPPSAFALQLQEWVIDGRLTPDEAVAMLTRHYTGRTQA